MKEIARNARAQDVEEARRIAREIEQWRIDTERAYEIAREERADRILCIELDREREEFERECERIKRENEEEEREEMEEEERELEEYEEREHEERQERIFWGNEVAP
jgi:hypothetical protein